MNKPLDKHRTEVQLLIKNYLSSEDAPAELKEVFNYTMLSPGKLLRPIIVSLFAESFDLKSLAIDNFKLAIEMLHTASLIHDDLPGLDNDSYRRGKPSVHIKYGEGRAILSGDLMFAKALNLLSNKGLISVLDSLSLIELLVQAQVSLCEGQAAELELKCVSYSNLEELVVKGSKKDAISILEDVNLRKTGALFIAAALGPAILTQQPLNMLNSLIKLMSSFSLAFQIKDDILDSIHDSERKDIKEFNHVSLLGVEESQAYLNSLVRDTIDVTNGLGPKFSDFLVLIEEVFG